MGIIQRRRSIIVDCDVESMGRLKDILRQTSGIEGIGGYKIDVTLAEQEGLRNIVRVAREITEKPLIYDAQKAATDIPDTQKGRVQMIERAGVSAIIGFPLTGPRTLAAFVNACEECGITPIIGGEMTHEKFKRSEGGYVADEALDEIYELGASKGVVNFVVPGNKVERIEHYYSMLKPMVAEVSKEAPVFFSPGLIKQGGNIEDALKVAGPNWHAIVGRGITGSKDMRAAALEAAGKLSV
ncbi:MAG: orotidine 5'-phosphate decarboxylase [Candidatus Micrarchaeota archaeon]|nr:orotidine 5'-phosphate decarboxylase [Candidatus Micrarchaeota archaeon]